MHAQEEEEELCTPTGSVRLVARESHPMTAQVVTEYRNPRGAMKIDWMHTQRIRR